MPSPVVLLVDDEMVFSESVLAALSDAAIPAESALTWDEAVAKFRVGMHELVIADFDLGGSPDGFVLLGTLKQLRPSTRLILISGKSITVPAAKITSTRLVDKFLVKDGQLIVALVSDAKEALARSQMPSDWKSVAGAHLSAGNLKDNVSKEVDALMQQGLLGRQPKTGK